jgi:hypothetical protein
MSKTSIDDLTTIQQGVITEFGEPMVNVSMRDNGTLTITLVNSALQGLGAAERAERAKAIARFAAGRWQGTPALTSVAIGFRKAGGVGALSMTYTETPYSFGAAELRAETKDSTAPPFGLPDQRKARLKTAFDRLRSDTVLWHRLSAGPRRPLTETPLVLSTEHDDFRVGRLGDSIDGSIASRFAGVYLDSVHLARGTDIFLVARVTLPSSVGIVLRVPGMYDPSTLDLWVVRPEPFAVSGPIPIADIWGDAGAATHDRASLRLVDGVPVLVLTVCSTYQSIDVAEDDSTGSDEVEIVRDSLYIGRWTGDSFAVALHATPATASSLEGTGLRPCATE